MESCRVCVPHNPSRVYHIYSILTCVNIKPERHTVVTVKLLHEHLMGVQLTDIVLPIPREQRLFQVASADLHSCNRVNILSIVWMDPGLFWREVDALVELDAVPCLHTWSTYASSGEITQPCTTPLSLTSQGAATCHFHLSPQMFGYFTRVLWLPQPMISHLKYLLLTQNFNVLSLPQLPFACLIYLVLTHTLFNQELFK